jgi:hypothetical protein
VRCSSELGQPARVGVVRGGVRIPGSDAPMRGREAGCEAGWNNWPVRSLSEVAKADKASSYTPADGGPRGSRAAIATAKATEGVWEPEAGTEEPSGVVGSERSDGCLRKWGGPPRPRPGVVAGSDACL